MGYHASHTERPAWLKEFCLSGQVAEAEGLEDSTRQLAAEFVVTLCEAREKAPGMMRKLPDFVGCLFQCLVTYLLDVEV